jgi:hypothetical protein
MHAVDWYDTDEGMLDELRQAVFSPEALDLRIIAAAKSTYTWRNIDHEIATLTNELLMRDLTSRDGGADDGLAPPERTEAPTSW